MLEINRLRLPEKFSCVLLRTSGERVGNLTRLQFFANGRLIPGVNVSHNLNIYLFFP